jgi:hypothetical protein
MVPCRFPNYWILFPANHPLERLHLSVSLELALDGQIAIAPSCRRCCSTRCGGEELCKLKVKDFQHAREGVPHLRDRVSASLQLGWQMAILSGADDGVEGGRLTATGRASLLLLTVKSEGELFNVVVKMNMWYATLVSAKQPLLQKRGNIVDAWHRLLSQIGGWQGQLE